MLSYKEVCSSEWYSNLFHAIVCYAVSLPCLHCVRYCNFLHSLWILCILATHIWDKMTLRTNRFTQIYTDLHRLFSRNTQIVLSEWQTKRESIRILAIRYTDEEADIWFFSNLRSSQCVSLYLHCNNPHASQSASQPSVPCLRLRLRLRHRRLWESHCNMSPPLDSEMSCFSTPVTAWCSSLSLTLSHCCCCGAHLSPDPDLHLSPPHIVSPWDLRFSLHMPPQHWI